MFALPKNKEGYKETTLYLLSNGCMVQTNDDIEITEDIRLALAAIVKKAHDDRIDHLCEKFGGGNNSARKEVRNENKKIPGKRKLLFCKIFR